MGKFQKKKKDENKLAGKEYFFQRVEEFLRKADDTKQWCMISIDIDNLKLFNEWYGQSEGDILLEGISKCLREQEEREDRIAGYFGNDNFALMMKYDRSEIEKLYAAIADLLKFSSNKIGFLPAMGIYEISDKTEPAFKMYDRAEIARAATKGSYINKIKKFEKEMLEKMESQYILFSDIQRALKNKEFTFFLQPKCNMENGKIIGAEALARWFTKENKIISPGVFIPFLESSGFIAELDLYIWEEVCKWLKSMVERGLPVVPVSVNVSKADIYSVDIPAYFSSLVEKYELSPDFIEIEIMENTYTEDNAYISNVVAKLRKKGFHVLMDDFGNGYSSLNMLKDIEVDTIKIDMRFLDMNENNTNKGIDILKAVGNMARLMGIEMIAEGVENEKQKEHLLNMGYGYGQGFYFYHPIPVSEFEEIVQNKDNLDYEGFHDKKIKRIQLTDLLSNDIFSEIMINNMLGAVAFYDVFEGEITVTRCNDYYTTLIGQNLFNGIMESNLLEHIHQEYHESILKVFEEAKQNGDKGAEGEAHGFRKDGMDMWVNFKVFFIHEQDGHSIFYSSVSDTTEFHEKNEMLKQQNQVLQFLNNDMPGGYYRHKNNEDCDLLHTSKRFLDIFGFTQEEIQQQFDNKFINMVHPEDRNRVLQSIVALKENGGNYMQAYRMRSKSGYIRIIDQSRLVQYQNTEFFQGIILCEFEYYKQINVGEEMKNKDDDNKIDLMPCGVFRYEADGNQEFIYVSNSMLAMLGYSEETFREKFKNSAYNMVYEEDRERVSKEIKEQIQYNHYNSCEYRIEMADGSFKWVYERGRLLIDPDGKRWFYAIITDYDYLKEKYREKEWQQKKYKTLAEIPGMLVYDYVPEFDRLTMELTRESGKIEKIITEDFIKEIENHEWLAKETAQKQKIALQKAMLRPMSGTVEFKGKFLEDREFHWYRSYYKSLADEYGKIYRIVGRADNIEIEMQTISDWKRRAMRDSMTELLNNEAAKKIVGQAIRECNGGILYLIDVDDFKGVNDTLGHMQGDELLTDIADMIRSTFRRDDILARFGGDEFLVFIPGVVDEELAAYKAREFLEKVEKIPLSKKKKIGCSIGISITKNNTMTVDNLIHQADIALYQSKNDGKGKYTLYIAE